MADSPLKQAFLSHPRQWEQFSLVYPVISRRSRGLSVGVNLNPDTACNFDCIYCCVVRKESGGRRQETGADKPRVELDVLTRELDAMLTLVAHGEFWRHPQFADIPADYRRLNDIAFSGDGEPTACPLFPAAVDLVMALLEKHNFHEAKIVLITNATLLDRPQVEAALQKLEQGPHEIWAKLDAGTPEDFHRIDRTRVPFAKVLNNILECGRRRPITIQTMLLRCPPPEVPPEAPPEVPPEVCSQTEAPASESCFPDDAFISAYIDRLAELIAGGCQIQAVQLYTVARGAAEAWVSPASHEELEGVAQRVRERLPGVEVKAYG